MSALSRKADTLDKTALRLQLTRRRHLERQIRCVNIGTVLSCQQFDSLAKLRGFGEEARRVDVKLVVPALEAALGTA